MPDNRYFLDAPLLKGERCALEDQEFQHLTRVMRIKVGEEVELTNGKNQLALASVESLGKHRADLRILSVETSAPKAGPKIILAQAIPRLSHLEFILEKGTELGADAFWLFAAIRSEKEEFSPNQQKRMQLITIAAMKQCGRLDLPEIVLKPPLAQWQPLEHLVALYGDTRKEAPALNKATLLSSEEILFFVGPESGFDKKEIQILENKLRAQGVKLHNNILRVETAALAALVLLAPL